MKSILSILAFLTVGSSFAQATQTITCKFADATNPDQVLITLATDQTGTFVYSTGPQGEATTSADGNLALKRADAVPATDTAGFVTSVEVMQMTFKMPKAQILKTGVNFPAVLTTSISALNTTQDQSLNCGAI